jgi:hypothetical protein
MHTPLTRRRFLVGVGTATPALALASPFPLAAGDAEAVPTATITEGNLKVVLRDNARSPKVLSGLASLFHQKDAPAFDAFDPDSPGASAGLNFEHIISGHRNANNAFTPRHGKYALYLLPGGKSARLVRRREDDPWAVSSSLTYAVAGPHYIDVDFRCVPHDPARFGKRGYAVPARLRVAFVGLLGRGGRLPHDDQRRVRGAHGVLGVRGEHREDVVAGSQVLRGERGRGPMLRPSSHSRCIHHDPHPAAVQALARGAILAGSARDADDKHGRAASKGDAAEDVVVRRIVLAGAGVCVAFPAGLPHQPIDVIEAEAIWLLQAHGAHSAAYVLTVPAVVSQLALIVAPEEFCSTDTS